MSNKKEISSNCNNSCFKDSYQNINTPKMMIVSEDVLMMFENQITELKNLVASLSRPDEVILDNEEAAKFIKVSTRTLQKYRKQHLLTFSQHDRMIWYRKSDLLDFLQRHQINGR